ncbi:MAG: molybdopterin-dependent oxidoreductase, partial [Candidatus Eremiobacteraeota bacterium]|nr:molybdopterin-dependent oxidoreductase [Candidatus Eremiobacteraeota bacterium]
ALERTPFVVVSELFMTETAKAANLVLPVAAAFEKTGTTTNVTGDLLPVNAARLAPSGTYSDLEIIAGLAQALDVAMPTIEHVQERVIEAAAAAPDFTLGDERLCAAQPQGDSRRGQDDVASGLRVSVQARIFAGGGTVAHDAWIQELRPLPEAAVSTSLARKLNIETGDCVDLEGAGFTMHDLLVEVRPSLPDDVVAIIDGLPDAPANLFAKDAEVSVTNVRSGRELAGVAS